MEDYLLFTLIQWRRWLAVWLLIHPCWYDLKINGLFAGRIFSKSLPSEMWVLQDSNL